MTGPLTIVLIVLVIAIIAVGGPVIEAIINDIVNERRERRESLMQHARLASADPLPNSVGAALIGATGESRCPLKPYGWIVIAGERHNVKSEHGYIESGKAVRVVGTEGNVLVVRESDEPPHPPAA